jgi:streptogramin lyase
LWFTNPGTTSIGRITTTGVVTNFADPDISGPQAITVGPDGALWFTAESNSIGRITTAGVVTNFTDPGINQPYEITTGADGALWFTNNGDNTIGRITTPGAVTNYTSTGTRISGPWAITAGPDGAVWFTNVDIPSIGRITTTVTPEIHTIAPKSGTIGATVTITGLDLFSATQVAFNGTPATMVSDTATKIVVTVPAGATKGHVTVTTRAGTAISKGSFGIT